MNEFELIDRYFKRGQSRADVRAGVGDDAALLKPDPDVAVIAALASLSLKPGDPAGGAAFARALARAALNRLAARGAAPAWVTLALSVPAADSDWLKDFAATLFSAIEPYGAELIGGDTTRGPTTATLMVHAPAPDAGREHVSSPRAGDALYLTGDLGRAAATGDDFGLGDARPARVNEGVAAWPYSAAAGDLRESLAATLERLLGAHRLGAEIDSAGLPVAAGRDDYFKRPGGSRLLLEASADPELCFVVGPGQEAAFNEAMAALDCGLSRIGRVVNETGVHLR